MKYIRVLWSSMSGFYITNWYIFAVTYATSAKIALCYFNRVLCSGRSMELYHCYLQNLNSSPLDWHYLTWYSILLLEKSICKRKKSKTLKCVNFTLMTLINSERRMNVFQCNLNNGARETGGIKISWYYSIPSIIGWSSFSESINRSAFSKKCRAYSHDQNVPFRYYVQNSVHACCECHF